MAGSFNFGEWISARSVIGDTLCEIGEKNERLFVCTPDVGMTGSCRKYSGYYGYASVSFHESMRTGSDSRVLSESAGAHYRYRRRTDVWWWFHSQCHGRSGNFEVHGKYDGTFHL